MSLREQRLWYASSASLGAISGSVVGHAIGAAAVPADPELLALDEYIGQLALILAGVGALTTLALAALVPAGHLPSGSPLRRLRTWPGAVTLAGALVGSAVASIAGGALYMAPAGAFLGPPLGMLLLPVLVPMRRLATRARERPGSLVGRAHARRVWCLAILSPALLTLLVARPAIGAVPPLLRYPAGLALLAWIVCAVVLCVDCVTLRRLGHLRPEARGWVRSEGTHGELHSAPDLGAGGDVWIERADAGPGYRAAPESRVVLRGDPGRARLALGRSTIGSAAMTTVATVLLASHVHHHLSSCERAFHPSSIVLSSTQRIYRPVCPGR